MNELDGLVLATDNSSSGWGLISCVDDECPCPGDSQSILYLGEAGEQFTLAGLAQRVEAHRQMWPR